MVQNDQSRGKRKQRTGSVISHAMQKTIVVKLERRVRHPFYGKEMKLAQKIYAHDEKDEAQAGDKVLIAETRPLSKLKRWRLVKVLQSGTYKREAKNEIQDTLSPGRSAPAKPGSAMAERDHEGRDV